MGRGKSGIFDPAGVFRRFAKWMKTDLGEGWRRYRVKEIQRILLRHPGRVPICHGSICFKWDCW